MFLSLVRDALTTVGNYSDEKGKSAAGNTKAESNPKEWRDVQFMIDASCEILEADYEKAFSILRQGIEENLPVSNEPIDNKRLLHTLRLLISSIEKSLKDNFGIKPDAEKRFLIRKTGVVFVEQANRKRRP